MQTAWRRHAEWPGLETARRPATAARHGDVRDVHPMALHTATGAQDPRPLTAAGWTLQASKSHLEEGPLYNAVKIKIKKYEMNPWWQKNVFFSGGRLRGERKGLMGASGGLQTFCFWVWYWPDGRVHSGNRP